MFAILQTRSLLTPCVVARQELTLVDIKGGTLPDVCGVSPPSRIKVSTASGCREGLACELQIAGKATTGWSSFNSLLTFPTPHVRPHFTSPHHTQRSEPNP